MNNESWVNDPYVVKWLGNKSEKTKLNYACMHAVKSFSMTTVKLNR